jgi:hypothetical protein
MSKILIYELHPHDVSTYVNVLTTAQLETILGGGYPYGFHIMNSTDRTYVNAVDNSIRFDGGGAGSINMHDNKYNTIDYSRSVYSNFI